MTLLNQSGMEDMLQQTSFCNFDHPSIQSLAENLAGDEQDPKKITETIFKYVRDNIRFGFDIVQVTASDTLEKDYGACWNKALLMVALLRYNKIPSRIAYNPVKRAFMKPALGDAYLSLNETMNHCFGQVYLDDQWVLVNPALDQTTYQKLFIPFNVSWEIDWDGTGNMLLYTENICGPVVFFPDIDQAFLSDVGNVLPPKSELIPFLEMANKAMWKMVDKENIE
jgi:transglutaminase-like putative cysteine protease